MKKPIIDNRLRKPNSDRDLRTISIHAKKRFKERFEYRTVKIITFLTKDMSFMDVKDHLHLRMIGLQN